MICDEAFVNESDCKPCNENSVNEADCEPCIENLISEPDSNKSYEEMTVEELQAAILYRLSRNGPVTEQMKKDVYENVYHNSLINWIKSFN